MGEGEKLGNKVVFYFLWKCSQKIKTFYYLTFPFSHAMPCHTIVTYNIASPFQPKQCCWYYIETFVSAEQLNFIDEIKNIRET